MHEYKGERGGAREREGERERERDSDSYPIVRCAMSVLISCELSAIVDGYFGASGIFGTCAIKAALV